MPEKILKDLKKNIPSQWKVCFFAALIMGIAAHLYKITNWLPNWDSLVFRYDAQNMISLGRWFLPVVCAPSSFYDLPFVNGLIAIIFHGLGAVCICQIFKVEKNVTAALIGALVATFPAVTSIMMYGYVADGYAISFLFSTAAALCMTKEKPNYIGAIIFIAFSVGIYQAYITVTVMLLLCYLIIELIHKNTTVKEILIKSVKFLVTGILGMVLYYVIMNLILKITGAALLEYQGIDSAFSIQNLDILASLYVIKHSFTDYFFDFSSKISVFTILNCIICLVTVLVYIADVFKKKIGIAKILLLCVYVVLLPIGASILAFINSSVDYHNLMKMGFCVFYLFLILQYERTDEKNEKNNIVKAWCILSFTAVLIFNQVIIANVSYHKLDIAYEKSYGTLIRIADRIEQTEDSEQCDSILIIGALPGSEAYSAVLPPDMTGTTDGYILRADDEIVGQSVLCSALNDYCGKNYRFIYGEEKANLLEKIDMETLDTWPLQNSIYIIDNVIILNLCEEG